MSERQESGGTGGNAAMAFPQTFLVALVAMALGVALTVAIMSQTSSRAGGGVTIDSDQAIEAAVAAVEADGFMSLDGRITIAVVQGDDWLVSFPLDLNLSFIWGDVDCSGDISSVDALNVLRRVALLPVAAPEGCPEVGEEVDPEDLSNFCRDEVCSELVRGGEPNVIVDGADGSIIEIFYGQ
jgi:hypothetical protein